jgi:hypothetical protein
MPKLHLSKVNKWIPLFITLLFGLSLAGLTLFILVFQARAVDNASATLYVAPDGDDTRDCASIANRCRTIQRAIDMAVQGDTIKAAMGTYTDTDTAALGFLASITKTITLKGGYEPNFVEPPYPSTNPTILDAQGFGRVLAINNAGPTIDGFIITGGKGDFSGGGIKIENGSPIIKNNLIMGNDAAGDGGAIFASHGTVQILNNQITNNTATWAAGLRLINDVNATVIGNIIQDNIAAISGGGIYLDCCSGPTSLIAQNRIIGNTTGNSGGGLLINAANASVVNNILAQNQAIQGDNIWLAGSVSFPISLTLMHNTLVGSLVDDQAIWVEQQVEAKVVNNIFVEHSTGITNTAPLSNTLYIDHNLFWNLTDPITGSNPLVADPLLDAGFHLLPGSPAIDAALPSEIHSDIDGQFRPLGSAPDLGADEFGLPNYLPIVIKNKD